MALHSVTVPIASAKKLPMCPVTAGWAVDVRQRAADLGVELREVARAGGISSQTLSGLVGKMPVRIVAFGVDETIDAC